MANQGFGGANDFEALSRQYWTAWGEAMRAASGQPAVAQAMPGMQGWQDAVDWWSKLAHGGRSEANDVVERFNAQARHWFGQMQQVAAQFGDQGGNAHDITAAWKKALGAAGENPFPEIFRSVRGQGQQGMEQWIEDAAPYLEAWRRDGMSWLSMPAFGLNREHQERLQALARAQVDYQDKNSAYNALMLKAGQRAFELFEDKLAEREEPGRQIGSARALFDLWIDAAEESYAEIALSPEFRSVYGALVNAQMRLRSGIQKEVELAGAQFGMPTRTEMDAAHRKIAELERMVRRLRDAAAPVPGPAPRAAGGKATPAARKSQAGKRASAKPKTAKVAPPTPARARPVPRKAAKKTTTGRTVRAAAKPAAKRAPARFAGISSPVAPDAPIAAARKRKTGKGARR